MNPLITAPAEFEQAFFALTGHKPMRWQCRLYERLLLGDIPAICTLPTGLGKTSVITIWLLAVAASSRADDGQPRLPRRLVYIVNRRTVVDQATDDAERLLPHLLDPPADAASVVLAVRDALSKLSGDPETPPLAVSTLRGELADNGEWKKNPARPAIIIGTIDMIGSRLLFSGYGDGRYGRAHHAGLIGQDTLIVHDEAHLSPAFDALLYSVEAEQRRTGESRPIRVMRLTATTRTSAERIEGSQAVIGIETEDLENDSLVGQRLHAAKQLLFHDVEKGKLVEIATMEALRLGQQPNRVLVYVRSPDIAKRIAGAITAKLGSDAKTRVGLLTGTIRGYERDALARSPLFAEFRSNKDRKPLAKSCYLVSTSAGEVGADLDADHLICDLSTLDSMVQRFGRVNRLGGVGRSAEIVIVMEKASNLGKDRAEKKQSPLDEAIERTGEILRKVADDGGDVSPAALWPILASDNAKAAFSPTPKILPATDILFDHWSLTSIGNQLPGRPEVGPYLHGIADWEPPETHVAWRADIGELARAGGKDAEGNVHPALQQDLEEVFEAFPLRSIEQLRDRTDHVVAKLQRLAGRHPEQPVVLMKNGEARWMTLSAVAPASLDKKRITSSPLAYATVVLPTEIGGLNQDGYLDGDTSPPEDHRTLDVAEAAIGRNVDRQRVLVDGSDENDDGIPILGGEPMNAVARYSVTLASGADDEDGTPRAIEYRVAKGEEREPGRRVALDEHNIQVGAIAARIAASVGLMGDIASAVTLAGERHDTGKGRDVWQRYAMNLPYRETPGGPIAKSDRYAHWKSLGGYRHEFGSLLDAALGPVGGGQPNEIVMHPERDLLLHLMAAHHGWGRPHFEARHFDPHPRPTAANEQIAVEAMQCFSRLQERFGRWGLAWLESLLRCADAMASQQEQSRDRERVDADIAPQSPQEDRP